MDHPTLPVVIGLLLILFAAWLVTGGPDKYESTAGKFIEPAAPLGTGEIYDEELIDRDNVVESILNN